MKVSVIMAVFNAGKFLKPTVESVINQTMTDWELVAVDDCSTDDSIEILRSFNDPRIKIIEKKINSGAAESRNLAIQYAQGEYLAVLDADDISYPRRFEKQVDFLEKHPDIAIVGSYADAIDEHGNKLFDIILPLKSEEIITRLLFESAMVQSSAMMRSVAITQNSLYYDKAFTYVEDFELFQRASRSVEIANIPEVLIAYRYSPENITTRHYKEQSFLAIRAIEKHLQELQIETEPVQLELLQTLLYDFHPFTRVERIEFGRLYYAIFCHCKQSGSFSDAILQAYFMRFHRLSCAGKWGYAKVLGSVLDLLPILKNNFNQLNALSFVLFFKKTIALEVYQKLFGRNNKSMPI
ncbi:MAG: glycosyltransferase family 2 protein [Bacteroidota bacterium]|nr:glycosyltransferase family 2 protein [Bacteroidota bacterium]